MCIRDQKEARTLDGLDSTDRSPDPDDQQTDTYSRQRLPQSPRAPLRVLP